MPNPNPPAADCCRNCACWKPLEHLTTLGRCQHDCPVPHPAHPPHGLLTHWPVTKATDWCGQFAKQHP